MVEERDPKFYSELKQMNEDLLKFLKVTHEKSPYFDFSPTFNDYVRQIGELDKQYQPSKLKPFAQIDTQPFLFGAPSITAPVSSSISTPTPTSFFSFSIPPKKEEPTSIINNSTNNNDTINKNEAEEADVPPPEPKIDKYEEPDAKYSVKCKLYEKGKMIEGEVNVSLLGIGYLYVKALDVPNKLQVIFRQDPDLRRVLLNEVVTSNIPVKLLPKAIQMIFPGPTGENKFYIAKLKDETDANTLYEMLNLSAS